MSTDYCMVQFVKPNLLGKYNEYLNRFVNPITNGQYTDSTEQDIRVMKRRSHVLHKMLDGAVQVCLYIAKFCSSILYFERNILLRKAIKEQ